MSSTGAELVTPRWLRSHPLSEPGVGKESRGTVLVLGGSATTPGAVRLAGEAALRCGAGKLMIATARSVAPALGAAVPEARVLALEEDNGGSVSVGAARQVVDACEGVDALLAGPGFVDPGAAVALLSAILPDVRCPVALDALGTAYVTARPHGLRHLGAAVVTANTSELALMLQRDEDETAEQPLVAARDLAARTGLVVLVGGEGKHIAAPDGQAWAVEGGGPGLGVSGSGDVQAGIVGGLLARGEEPAKAAAWAAYLHARAGERLAGSIGRLGYLARELPPTLPRVMAEVS
jgi:hydroxyethylthiazole kinase-like uncharacterized protein yjeF